MNEEKTLPTRGRPKTRNKEYLLETAMHAYWQADGAAVSLNTICTIAQISKPSLYRDFGSEDGLTAAVLERYAKIILGGLKPMLESSISFNHKIENLINFACDDPRLEVGCLFVKMRATRSRFGAKTQEQITIIESDVLESYAQFLKDSAAKVKPELAAIYLHEQMGLAISQRAARQHHDLTRKMLILALSVLYTHQ